LTFLALGCWGGASIAAADKQPSVYVLDIDGAIGPATRDYVDRSITQAEAQEAELVVLRMDTPGGLDTAMRAIIKRILSSSVPVVTYVAPAGARAASAGTYILYASHIAAMAPGTNLGAATPIELGGLSGTSGSPDAREQKSNSDDQRSEAQGLMPADAHKAKLVNDAAAYLESLARLRKRNETWAEQAVRTAASLPAEQALQMGVVNLLATDMDQLLHRLDGVKVSLPAGPRVLHTAGTRYLVIEPDWGNRLLAAISNPTLAYILLLLGIYGLIHEFSNPGTLLPGTAGAVSLLLALYAFQVLPVNYAGLALIVLGLLLMLAEALVPSFGALGVGGIIAFIFGSLILIDTSQGGASISWPVVVILAVLSATLIMLITNLALKSRRRPVVSGEEELPGARGIAVEDFTGDGTVRVRGELWSARVAHPLHRGQAIRVVGRDGLVLLVSPENKEDNSP
jgi:membrane-bound serine protease (ClpP class)